MRIVIATAGVLPPEPVARFVEQLIGGETSSVYVVTVIEAPRSFLDDIRSEEWRPFDEDLEAPAEHTEDVHIRRYVEERGSKLIEPVMSSLRSRMLDPVPVFVEGGDPGAGIVEAAIEHEADLIVMGATRQLFTESAWMSVSLQVTRQSNLPVLLIPAPAKSAGEPTEDIPVVDEELHEPHAVPDLEA